jgi:hypothetical protein
VHRIAGRESLVTPVATPAENAVVDKPAVSSSKEVANSKVSVITNGLHTDLGDLPLGLGIQKP